MSSSTFLINPLLEETTINPNSALPSFLEMKLLEASFESYRTALSASMEAFQQHMHRLSSALPPNQNNPQLLQKFKMFIIRVISNGFRNYQLELQLLITYIIERKALSSQSNSTLTEALFGFRRSKVLEGKIVKSLDKKDMIKAALLVSFGSYFTEKLNKCYLHLLNINMRAENIHSVHPEEYSRGASMLEVAKKSFLYIYPFLHMTKEGLNVAYNLMYMIQKSPYYDPSLHALGQVIRRTNMHDTAKSTSLVVDSKNKQTRQQKIIEKIKGPASLSLLGLFCIGWIGQLRQELRNRRRRFLYNIEGEQSNTNGPVTENCDSWNSWNEERKSNIPPPLPPVSQEGNMANYPTNPSVCPLCKQKRLNPTASTSGFVFCFKCIALYLRENGERCPVTGMKCQEPRLVRIYESTG